MKVLHAKPERRIADGGDDRVGHPEQPGQQVGTVHAFVEQRPASRLGRVDVPAIAEVRLQAIEMAVPNADQRDAAEITRRHEFAQELRDRVEALGEALHEQDAGRADGADDFFALLDAFRQRLFAEYRPAAGRGAANQRRMRGGLAADRHGRTRGQQCVRVVEERRVEPCGSLGSTHRVRIPDSRQNTALGEYFAPKIGVVVGEGQHADAHGWPRKGRHAQDLPGDTRTALPPVALECWIAATTCIPLSASCAVDWRGESPVSPASHAA